MLERVVIKQTVEKEIKFLVKKYIFIVIPMCTLVHNFSIVL
jgi:hypothetical protein